MEKLKDVETQECTQVFFKARTFSFIDCNYNGLHCIYPVENNGEVEGEEERKSVQFKPVFIVLFCGVGLWVKEKSILGKLQLGMGQMDKHFSLFLDRVSEVVGAGTHQHSTLQFE